MRVNRLVLSEFRAFHELDMEFHGNLTVLVGVNGAGKSSVLEALAILLSPLVDGIRTVSGKGKRFKVLDIRNKSGQAKGIIEISMNGRSFEWSIVTTRPGRKKSDTSDLGQLKEALAPIFRGVDEQGLDSVPVAVFYGVHRAVMDIPLRIRKRHTFDILSTYDSSSLGAKSDFRLFFEWFRNREDIENEIRLDLEYHHEDTQLRAVRTAVERLTGFSGLRVRRSPLRMEVQKSGQTLNVAQLSDGEKCLFALVGDLARRLAVANPGYSNPLEGHGVVLIDEIDLHLHPEWQHKIIPNLLETFPNCQFIVTTHSPQVLSHIKSENIRLLDQTEDGVKVSEPDGTYGHDSNFLLKTLFGSTDRPNEPVHPSH